MKLDATGIEQLIGDLARALAERPDLVATELKPLSEGAIVTLQAHAADTRILIGKGARNFRALETIVALASFGGAPVTLGRIREPERGRAEGPLRGRHGPSLSEDEIGDLLRRVADACLGPDWEVELSTDEDGMMVEIKSNLPQGVAAVAGVALKQLFGGVGATNGHVITVVMVNRPPAERQPNTAAGRYTGET